LELGTSAVAKAALGQRLREVRQCRGLSQAKLARAIGVTVGTIQAYEHDRSRVTVDRLLAIAAVFQCEPGELLAPPGTALLPRYPSNRILRGYRVGEK
jgi:transcriptional regulator with XRE-family HTH domain